MNRIPSRNVITYLMQPCRQVAQCPRSEDAKIFLQNACKELRNVDNTNHGLRRGSAFQPTKGDKMTLIKFQVFEHISDIDSFVAYNATPEREDDQLGQLPDGTPVWPVYQPCPWDSDSQDIMVTARLD